MTKTINHIEAEDGLKTYVTKNYGMFTMLEDNRMINMPHVNRLMEAIKAKPEGLRLEPIIVNEKLEIIDGQHRLRACEALDYPIYYQIGKGLTVDDAVRMNAHRRNWTPLDYAYSYAGRGNAHYQIYVDFHHKHEELQHETLMGYLRNGDTQRAYLDFREGKFLVYDDTAEIEKRLVQYFDIIELLPNRHHGQSGTFARAVLSVIKHQAYDHDRMKAKMEFAASKYLTTPFIIVEDAQRALESVYNESARAHDRVRLF